MEALNKRLASLRLDDEPPRSRRGAWSVIALPVFIVAAGTIFWWGPRAFAATKAETTMPRAKSSEGAPSGMPLLTTSGYATRQDQVVVTSGLGGTEMLIVSPPPDLSDGTNGEAVIGSY